VRKVGCGLWGVGGRIGRISKESKKGGGRGAAIRSHKEKERERRGGGWKVRTEVRRVEIKREF